MNIAQLYRMMRLAFVKWRILRLQERINNLGSTLGQQVKEKSKLELELRN